MSAVSYSQDLLVSPTFLTVDPQTFESWLLSETGRVAGNYPERYKRFISPLGELLSVRRPA